MKASIIAVGTELLFGKTVNTNAAYLSDHLNLMGFDVMYHYVVGDNPSRLKETLMQAFYKTDLVILTGGLGPTQDDLTKETVAEFMGAPMYSDERVVADLKEHYTRRGIEMTDNNLKQALLPEGCTVFYNASGMAPGFALEKKGKCAICLPGPPREMKYLFENFVSDFLKKFMGKAMYYRTIRVMGIGEAALEDKLLPLIDGQTDPTLATYVKEGQCTLRIASQRDTIEEAEAAVNEMLDRFDELCGQYAYSYDDEEIEEVVVKELMARGLTISSAESCTGGNFAGTLTNVSGSSKVFKKGWVTYSNEAKVAELGVDPELIKRVGVVSPEVAVAMVNGVMDKSEADVGISITGYAGPDADEGHEAGEAYIGYSYKGSCGSIAVKTGINNRNINRYFFKLRMFSVVYMLIKERFDLI